MLAAADADRPAGVVAANRSPLRPMSAEHGAASRPGVAGDQAHDLSVLAPQVERTHVRSACSAMARLALRPLDDPM